MMRKRSEIFLICWLIGRVWQVAFAQNFDFERLRERAHQAAAAPFVSSSQTLPAAISNLSYVAYSNIQFEHANALWARERLPFQLEFFHPGYVHKRIVPINEIDGTGVHSISYSPKFFSYGTNQFEPPRDLGFAGFRIVSTARQFGEVASFLGASYFRMIGRGQIYGTSARGIALNTGAAEPEEFPEFREFWVRKPQSNDTNITVFAFLDGPSVAGAYQFDIRPGRATVAHVKASLFPRKPLKRLGIAPLTSMFLHDQNSHPPFSDFRPEVHDADGLLMETGRGEWIWRSLDSGKMIRINAYQDENPQGFGLLQRDRKFDHFQDLIARFELRPSVWVRPLGHWGKGAVELVQLPSNVEFSDNTVAFWVPASPPNPGESLDLSYELHWTTNHIHTAGRVRDVYIGNVVEEPPKDPPNLRFVIDFEGVRADEPLQAEVECGDGTKFIADTITKNPLEDIWRLVVEITRPSKAVDLRAALKKDGKTVTETWAYTWQP